MGAVPAVHPGARQDRLARRASRPTTDRPENVVCFQQPPSAIPPSAAVSPQALAVRDELILAHQQLVVDIARRCARILPYWRDHDELVAEGQLGLIDAASKFDPSRGIPFPAFARKRIRGAIIDAFRRRNYDWELHAELDDSAAVEPPEPAAPLQKKQAAALLELAMRSLNPAERSVIRSALRGEKLKEYGRSVGITESFACLLRQSAEQKLRGVLEACGHTPRTLA